ncbi:protein cordon-bleu isoform X3 [Alosa sapidissima]|uniref:protein cordon-bleu isoform X3 n=1 Tax=Alosa sapidissima TaxID=34773 RepID=UPI001C08DF76|nr:protein cordon-bleu isoform X3 [Alosa sapidissima]
MDSNSYSKPPIGRKMKNPAPPPPGPPQPTPRRLPRNIVPDGGVAVSTDIKENVLQPHVELQLSLPSGAHTTSTFDGRKALMDLLVEVCGQYHLNPAYHTLELLSSEGQPVAFKPNAFLGSLDVACALIKERVVDEKLVRKPVPRVPEKSVRLVVNYHRSQKTVVRVSPLVPLHALVPVICQKCEFDPAHVLLLRDSVSRHELDLDKSLCDLEIRELYAFDQSLESTCSTQSVGAVEKKGLLGFFKFNRRKSKTDSLSSSDMEEVDGDVHVVESAENDHYALSGVSTSLEARPSTLGQSQSVMNISKMSPKVELKKRRAPAPPPTTHQSYDSLGMHAGCPSTSSLLKKRKAPAPPPTPASHSPTPTPTPTPPIRSSPDNVPKAAPPASSAQATTTVAVAAITAATVALPPVTAVRRAARQDDSASEVSGASEESERAALCSSSSSQADSVPSSHLDEVATSSQDEEYEEEYEEVDEEEEDLEVDEMEMELQVLQQLQQRSRQQLSQPVVVERLQHRQQPAQLQSQGLREHQASEPKPQTQTPKPQTPQPQSPPPAQTQPPQLPQGPKQQEQQQSEEQLQDSDRSTTSAETGSTVSLRMDESESNRHSAIDVGRQVPVKPRRTSLGDQTSQAASASPALIDRNSHNASPDSFTDMPQHSWLHSARPAGGAEVPVDSAETGSVSSGSGSFADQGYAEESCPLSSPSDLTPPRAPRDLSSDSDEGCATWNSSTSQDLYRKGQSGKIKDSYEEDPKLMAQLQLTLADLDAELAEMNQSSECPSEADDLIPVSVVDLVPVTTIGEVLDIQPSNSQNKNNNATLWPEPAVQPRVSVEVKGSRSTQEVKQPAPDSKDKTLKSEPPLRESKAVGSATGTKPPSAKNSSVVAPAKAQPVGGSQSNRAPPRALERSKITQMPASRFGTKTFTIVPTKVAVPSSSQTQGSLTLGAIKIDERGNMVKGHGVQQCVGTPVAQGEKEEAAAPSSSQNQGPLTLGAIKIDERGNMVKGHGVRQCVGTPVAQGEKEEAVPLREKAKTFWTSTDKQEAPTATKATTKATTTTTTKTIVIPPPAPGGATSKPADKRQAETAARSTVSGINHSSTAKGGSQASQGPESRPPSSEPTGPAQRATPSVQDPRDLSFLKPQRRTSSQYMATALSNKLTVRPAARVDGIQEKLEPEPPAQKPLIEGRTATTASFTSVTIQESSGSSQVGVWKENGSVPSWTALKGPQAYKSHTFNKQTSVEPPRLLKGGAGTVSDVNSGVVNSKAKLTTHEATNRSSATHNSSVVPDQNPEPWAAPGVLAEPNQVSPFGPVKKFRPVIQKSAEKDTSLHSSLMQAIQSGDNKDRLKRVSEASAGSGLKKPALVEEENTQSALLSAIRANNSNRLKKTRSGAARELDRFRATESASGCQNQTSTLQHTSLPSAPAPVPTATPPPPPPPTAAPPPPPPPTAAPPPPRVVLPSVGNPEQTREALLDAIRSGAGAKGLKRVPVATKTVLVNGRLGTMTASCSLSQGL